MEVKLKSNVKALLKAKDKPKKDKPILVQIRFPKDVISKIKKWDPRNLSPAMKIKTIINNLLEQDNI